LFRGAIQNIAVKYFIDHDADYRKSVMVAGMGRSGTTWLADLLNYRNDYRVVFEPFNHRRVALAVNFSDHQYLRPSDDDYRYVEPARAILTGLVREHWVDRFNHRLIAHRRLVKDVRVNLILRWMRVHFPGMPIVLIARHPFAVAASRLSKGYDVDLQHEFLAQRALVEDFLQPYRDALLACRTPFERHVAAWCIEVGVPLSQFAEDEICLVLYEDLCKKPAEVLQKTFAFIGNAFDRSALRSLTRPSHTTYFPKRLRLNWEGGADRIVTAWQDSITPAQIRRGLEIVEMFGMNELYGADPMPVTSRYPRALAFQTARRDLGSAVS
jgi:hypothetical protein